MLYGYYLTINSCCTGNEAVSGEKHNVNETTEKMELLRSVICI